MTVLELQEKLRGYLRNLDRFRRDAKVIEHCNTYYVKSDEFLSIPGVGFICLDEIQIEGGDDGIDGRD